MHRKDDLFNYTLRELEKKGQHELSLHFQRQRFLGELNQKKELERMKKEIVEDVLSRISLNIEERITETLNRVFAEFERK